MKISVALCGVALLITTWRTATTTTTTTTKTKTTTTTTAPPSSSSGPSEKMDTSPSQKTKLASKSVTGQSKESNARPTPTATTTTPLDPPIATPPTTKSTPPHPSASPPTASSPSARGSFLFYLSSELRSVDISMATLVEALVRRGHRVVAASPFVNEKLVQFPNYEHLYNEHTYREFVDKWEEMVFKEREGFLPVEEMKAMWRFNVASFSKPCTLGMKGEKFKRLVQQQRDCEANAANAADAGECRVFDVVVLMTPLNVCGYNLATVFNASLVAFVPQGPYFSLDTHMGNPPNPAYSMNPSPFRDLSFSHRLSNFLLYTSSVIAFNRLFGFVFEEGAKTLGVDLKGETLADAEAKMALQLVNTHPSIHGALPSLPNTILVGGIHCVEGSKIESSELKQFVDSAFEGFVLMSFGSTLKVSSLSPPKIKRVFSVFSSMSPLKFVVKWDASSPPPDLPSNVLLVGWTPQQALLAHPNAKVFVTHGGLLSVIESICHGVVIVGVPLVNDQTTNVNIVVKEGFGVRLDLSQLTEKLEESLVEALTNDSLRKVIKDKQKSLADQKEKPIERAVWWMEYLLRHPQADHLKPKSIQLNWIEFLLLDVILFLGIIFSICGILLVCCCRCCCKCCCKVLWRCCGSNKKRKYE